MGSLRIALEQSNDRFAHTLPMPLHGRLIYLLRFTTVPSTSAVTKVKHEGRNKTQKSSNLPHEVFARTIMRGGKQMEVTLDITKIFSSVINYIFVFGHNTLLMNPILFLESPFQFKENFTCELMNFALNHAAEMDDKFVAATPYFDDILTCDFEYKDILIFGKAKINVSNVKGVYMVLKEPSKIIYNKTFLKGSVPENTYGKSIYYEHSCEVKRGDYLFNMGGKSSFSNHIVELYLIADKDARATISFSSKDYVLRTAHDPINEQAYSKMQTPYSYVNNDPRPDILNSVY